jgi:hypothetical protein
MSVTGLVSNNTLATKLQSRLTVKPPPSSDESTSEKSPSPDEMNEAEMNPCDPSKYTYNAATNTLSMDCFGRIEEIVFDPVTRLPKVYGGFTVIQFISGVEAAARAWKSRPVGVIPWPSNYSDIEIIDLDPRRRDLASVETKFPVGLTQDEIDCAVTGTLPKC